MVQRQMKAGIVFLLHADAEGLDRDVVEHRVGGQIKRLHMPSLHETFGFGALQFIAGCLRGTKGGPTDRSLRDDHYDMTRRGILFEHVHRTVGYLTILTEP